VSRSRPPRQLTLHGLLGGPADPAWRLAQELGVRHVCGVDEVGRGPLAGPVVAAAVLASQETPLPGVADSKTLTPARRAALAGPIRQAARGVGMAASDVNTIDAMGIREATLQAMRRAVEEAWRAAGQPPCVVVVDGLDVIPGVSLPQRALVRGDAQSAPVAAASILAKEHRDAWMVRLASTHPGYGLDRHKGYGTAEHLAALRGHGPCAEHRRSFDPVRTFLETGAWPAGGGR
jgi:ribonuclease HII